MPTLLDMTSLLDWHTLRTLLGISQLFLALRIWHLNLGRLFCLLLYLAWSAVGNLIPAFPNESWWKYDVQIPHVVIGTLLAVVTSLDMFRFLAKYTRLEERKMLFAAGATAGFLIVYAGWSWTSENWFQSVMILRQYVVIALTTATVSAWFYVRYGRPVPMTRAVSRYGPTWCVWLVTVMVLASATKGGWLWMLITWSSGVGYWRVIGDVGLTVQLVLVCIWYAGLAKNNRLERLGQAKLTGLLNPHPSLPDATQAPPTLPHAPRPYPESTQA